MNIEYILYIRYIHFKIGINLHPVNHGFVQNY